MLSYNTLKKLYQNSGILIQSIYSLIPKRIKYGKTYFYWRKNYKQNLNRNPFKTYLQYQDHPFYAKKYQNIDIKGFNDIPLLSKHEIQNNLNLFKLKNTDYFVTTGGVTGNPGKFYQSKNVWLKEMAFVHSLMKERGYDGGKIALLKGGDQSRWKTKVYYYEPRNKAYMLSPFHLNKTNVQDYLAVLKEKKIKFLHAHPSAILHLQTLLEQSSLNYFGLRYILLTSEGFSASQIKNLKEFFKCEIISFYGHSERGVFAESINNLEGYRINDNYGYVELIDNNNEIIQKEGIIGEIVVTTYDNECMPLIRYRTGDYTKYISFKRKEIGLIQGKWNNQVLIGKNLEQISFTALNIHDSRLDNISIIQFIQRNPGDVKVRYSLKTRIDCIEKEEEKIDLFFKQISNNVIKFSPEKSFDFLKTTSGKTPLLVKEMK